MSRALSEKKLKFALLGHDIGYALSPKLHKSIFKKGGVFAEYSTFDVGRDRLSATVRLLEEEYDGFNITKPYKTDVFEMLSERDTEAVLCGNVNVAYKGIGYNTDYRALLKIMRASKIPHNRGKALIFGSGATARTTAVALSSIGVQVTVVCRNQKEGYAISDHLLRMGLPEITVIPLDLCLTCSSDIVVNTISSSFLDFPTINCRYAVNFNYGDRGMNFQKQLQSRPVIITGEEILLQQVIETETIWLGKRIDLSWEETLNG
ncbi:MAG: hypothetical protein LVQ96_03325 [Thermoplasmatales archaeon]|nr:hypothetical protein [Thermoplasmatales archaeon]MCW6170181.1 hypothetical protein [Thermoplasmatales archaeon]